MERFEGMLEGKKGDDMATYDGDLDPYSTGLYSLRNEEPRASSASSSSSSRKRDKDGELVCEWAVRLFDSRCR
jgi:hypothetical protein